LNRRLNLQVPRLERLVGIEVYATGSPGIGGTLREFVEDFVVGEMLVDGSEASEQALENQGRSGPLACSPVGERHLLCVMVKRNWDTLMAVKNVAMSLHVASDRVHIAGLKDAKAVTAQFITIEDVLPEQVRGIRVKDIEVWPLGYVRNELSAYYLLGNKFRIRIRAMNHSEATVRKRIGQVVEEVEELGGVPNFFGHQRFGTTRPVTHLVGKALVKGNLRKAAMLVLAKPSPHEHPSSRRARKQLKMTLNFEQALKNFPRQLRYERSMLRHLAKHPEDFAGAFKTLPFKLQEMFVQAYQSYLFNRFLSGRIALGLPLNRVEVGDYVVAVERSGLAMPTVCREAKLENRKEIERLLQAGKSRLAIPLVGFRQQTSRGVQGEIEKRILHEENVAPGDFRILDLPRISSRGRLRTAITSVNSFSVGEVSNDANKPSRRDVEVSFMLHRGSYATVFLRELMKPRSVIRQGF
jgi:tRNA pseudouridine13 synthase